MSKQKSRMTSIDKKTHVNTEEQILSVWMATDAHLQNPWRFLTYADKGILRLSRNNFLFYGDSGTITIRDVDELDITFTKFPWGNGIIAVALIAFFVYLEFQFVSWKDAQDLLILFLFCLLPMTFFVEKTRLWIKIKYQDENNIPQDLYLLDGSWQGWGGVFGGTLHLYKKIRAIYSK
ncbi:MAG: hypothetical protein U0Z26_19665 [Anaerolineales bacterium]